MANENTSLIHGRREPKDLHIETYAKECGKENKGLLKSSTQNSADQDQENDSEEGNSSILFLSGNPFVEITRGVLHLYKEK